MTALAAVLSGWLVTSGVAAAAPAASDDGPWDIAGEHGSAVTLRFDTDEGTWLALDVAADGRDIVFSLLGDLYLLPIAGGAAKRLTTGPAWDVQPRFSPDGSRIAFASDRSGLENLWLVDRDGGRARQVSHEESSTVSQPAWSPDGHYLVGRKRLTDTSSLGTVELWMWHVLGGDGIQLTKKEDQPDAADPAFSRDGRFLYFSARDSRYRYDRNVNQGIWQLKRLDRHNGRTIALTSSVGGAAVPTLSPDGRNLAYVRRLRARTRIEILALDTGQTRFVSDEVERDNQEGFAFHGVFPGFAWTPDGVSLIATGDGRIWRYDAATGARAPIPFTATVEQKVTDAVRFPRRVGADAKLRSRVVRWPVESPDGKLLVFSSMGHLYAMDLPGGTARRLTRADDFEFAPAFSRDGSLLAWVSWSDRDAGAVWVAPWVSGTLGAARRITTPPAQYANPAFSPDGQRVVYVKGSGATFREGDLADELWQEIRWSTSDGLDGGLVSGTGSRGSNRRMARPHFANDGERVFYLEDLEAEKPNVPARSVLLSVRLDGTDRRIHLNFAGAEEAAVSPDGRHVAFSEQHNAWMTVLPRVKEDGIELDLEKPALPLVKLTDDGGEWVAFPGGGGSVSWVTGPFYRRADVAATLDWALAKKEKKEKEDKREAELPPSETIEVVLELARARPSEVVVYRGAKLITMRGDEIVPSGTIVVDGDRIAAVGDDAVAIPSGARVVDVAGSTIIPGLFDAHAHLHYSTLDILPQRPWKYLANLAYGVTSTHDPSAATQEVFAQAEMVEAGLIAGPRIFSTGYILYGAADPNGAVIDSLDAARRHLRRLKRLGAFSVKSYMQPRREQRQWILQAAREERMLVVPEGGGDLEMDLTMIADGHTTLEHSLPITPLRKDVITLLARSQTAYTPTLLVAYGGLSGDRWFHQHYDIWKDEKLLSFVPQGIVDNLGRIRSIMANDDDWHHFDVARSAAAVLRAGGRVCMGGHGQMQGLGPHWEMWSFVHGGMTPHEALTVATRMPAEALGLDQDLGSLAPGKLADFVVLAKDPLEKIENSDSVEWVVKNGVAYRPEDLRREPERN